MTDRLSVIAWKSRKDEFEIENGMEYDLIPITQTQVIVILEQIDFSPKV